MISTKPLPTSTPAAVLEGPRQFKVKEIPMWPLDDYGDSDLVLVEIAACGVCGSDFRYYVGENPWAQHTLGRFVPNPPNIVLGHEYAGTVVAAASQSNRHLLGKRVAPICSKVCGACEECRAGRSRMCPNTVHMGHGQGWGQRDYYPGAYCRYAVSWGASCYEISDALTFPEAAMMDILAVCAHVADVAQIQPGRPALCIGAGPAGNGVAQAALALGADRVVLIDPAPHALALAREVGIAVDSTAKSNSELIAELRAIAPGGYAAVFDSVGTGATLDLGISCLSTAGVLVNLAVHDEPIGVNFMRLGAERRMVTSCNFEIGDYTKALAWLEAGRFRVKNWFTHVTLADLPGRFESIVSNPDEKGVFKMVVDPWA